MSRWYRAYEGTVTDAKLAEAAMVADVSRAVSIAAWHCLLESAAAVNNCGSFDTSPRRVSIILCEPPAAVEALFAAYAELGLIGEGTVLSWKKRQHESDNSAERTRKWREKKRQETAVCDSGDGDATSRDAPEAETETEEESSYEDSPSDDGPSLKPEHVFEFYRELAEQIGRPVPRDFTPERRQLTKARIAQYSLEDFQTVFAKCRDSPFLRGDKGRTPLTFDWLMKKGNFQKVLEGNYDS
jgi:hypothetical protein